MSKVLIDKPLVISLGETLSPGLARVVVRNWWPWVKARTAREALRSDAARCRAALVLLQAGRDPLETIQLVRFLRAPWRRSAVVVIEAGEDPVSEMALRREGVACFLSASDVEPELIEDLVASILSDPTWARNASDQPEPAALEEEAAIAEEPLSIKPRRRPAAGGGA